MSAEGAGSWQGSLSSSDCDLLEGTHRRREEAWVSGQVSEVQAQVPKTQGASCPLSLILLGLWGAQVVPEAQVYTALSLTRDSRSGGVPKQPSSALGAGLAGLGEPGHQPGFRGRGKARLEMRV